MRRRGRAEGVPDRGRTLLVVGDTLHAVDAEGRYCTHGALARQLDQWFAEFDRVVIAAVLTDETPPVGFRAYRSTSITFVPLEAAGGTGIRAKASTAFAALSWIRTLVPLLRRADVVHLRSPCNVTLVALPLARFLSAHRYAIYAGAWDPPAGGPLSYTIQRWMVRRFGGIVHVYAPESPALPPNARPNFSPTHTEGALEQLGPASARRLLRIQSTPPAESLLRVACVGRFSPNKNQAGLVRAIARLRDRGVPVELRFAGEGAAEPAVRALVAELGLDGCVSFLGRCDQDQLDQLYEWADVNAMPSFVEGFGRVVLEGMALGCPALCGPGTMQRAMIGGGARGRQVDPADVAGIASTLTELRSQPFAWWEASMADCRAFAAAHTVERFGEDVNRIIDELDCRAS